MNLHVANTVLVLDDLAGISHIGELYAFQGFTKQIAVGAGTAFFAGNEQFGLETGSFLESAAIVDATHTDAVADLSHVGIEFH
jgi:hypothetical protein